MVRRFLEALTHCLVGADQLAALWGWLDMARCFEPGYDASMGRSPLWKAGVMQFVVESTMFWADPPNQLQSALRMFHEAVEANYSPPEYKHRKAPSRMVSCHMAWSWLHQVFTTCRTHTIDPLDFDRFIEFGHLWRKGHELAYSEARLHLTHPTRPSPQPALQCVRSWKDLTDQDYFRKLFLSPADSTAAFTIFWTTIKAAQQFERRGQVESAKEMIDIARKYLPGWFVTRKFDPLGGVSDSTLRHEGQDN